MINTAVFLLWFWNPGYDPPRWDYQDRSFSDEGACLNYKIEITKGTPLIFSTCSDHRPRWEPRDEPEER